MHSKLANIMHEQPRQAALVVISSAYTLGALILRSRARASNPHLSAEREHDTDSASWEISLGTDSRHEIIYPQQDDETRQDAVGRKQSEANAQDRTRSQRGYPLYPRKDPTLATSPITQVSSRPANFSEHELPWWLLQMLSWRR